VEIILSNILLGTYRFYSVSMSSPSGLPIFPSDNVAFLCMVSLNVMFVTQALDLVSQIALQKALASHHNLTIMEICAVLYPWPPILRLGVAFTTMLAASCIVTDAS
jgi:hypothetical protein